MWEGGVRRQLGVRPPRAAAEPRVWPRETTDIAVGLVGAAVGRSLVRRPHATSPLSAIPGGTGTAVGDTVTSRHLARGPGVGVASVVGEEEEPANGRSRSRRGTLRSPWWGRLCGFPGPTQTCILVRFRAGPVAWKRPTRPRSWRSLFMKSRTVPVAEARALGLLQGGRPFESDAGAARSGGRVRKSRSSARPRWGRSRAGSWQQQQPPEESVRRPCTVWGTAEPEVPGASRGAAKR